MAGGWTGGRIDDENVIQATKSMCDSNLITSVLAGHLAAKFLKEVIDYL